MTEEQIKKAYIVKQQRWLLFLRHASKCQAAEGQCQYTPHCHVAKSLWEHVLKCTNPQCQYPRCLASRELLKHHQNCKDARCPVCGPVRSAMLKQRSHMLMQQQQQAGQGPAKRARIDGAAAPAGPCPRPSAAPSDRNARAARERHCWSASPRTRCGRTSHLYDCPTLIRRRRGNRCPPVDGTPSRRRPSSASRNRRAARAG